MWGFKMALRLGTLASPPKDPSLVPSTHMTAQDCNSTSRRSDTLFLASQGTKYICSMHTYTQVQHPYNFYMYACSACLTVLSKLASNLQLSCLNLLSSGITSVYLYNPASLYLSTITHTMYYDFYLFF